MLVTEYVDSKNKAIDWLVDKFGLTRGGTPESKHFLSGDIWKWHLDNVEFIYGENDFIVINYDDEAHFLRIGNYVSLTEGNCYGYHDTDVRKQFGSVVYMESVNENYIALVGPEGGWLVYAGHPNGIPYQSVNPPFSSVADLTHLYADGATNIVHASNIVQISGNKALLYPLMIGTQRMKNLYVSPNLIRIGDKAGNYMCISKGIYYKIK